jgi:hypothetical protein
MSPLSKLLGVFILISVSLDQKYAAAFNPTSKNTKISCKDARIVDNSDKYCGEASWQAAHIYASANFSDYRSEFGLRMGLGLGLGLGQALV